MKMVDPYICPYCKDGYTEVLHTYGDAEELCEHVICRDCGEDYLIWWENYDEDIIDSITDRHNRELNMETEQ